MLRTVPVKPIQPFAPSSSGAAQAPGAAVLALAPRRAPGLRPEDPNTTFLFTDIEGSTRMWEQEPQRMAVAMARHDALCRAAVQAHGGQVVKGTGDGIHAIFVEPLPALLAALQLQLALAEPVQEGEMALSVRAGLHCGASEPRDGDFYGPALNRAARVMGAAHGGQTLLTHEAAERLAARLPPPLTLADLGAVRLRDLGGPQRVHQLVHPQLRAQFPPLRSLEATPNNLAQQLNSFVGRERELAEVRELLGKTRLLTLLGVGGIGKSRLSVQLGAELLDEYPDGVWLVELAPLADARRVPQALATVLGVREDSARNLMDALLAYVRDKRMLVILDNCEHVVQACAALAKQLLQSAAGVKVLTSSRDVLQVAGEVVYQVPTLSVPTSTGDVDAASLTRHEAVHLFVDRATAVQSAFRLDSSNAAAVADICRRLDGIPLALELAAARTRAMSVQAISARLSDRFRLLVSGDRTVLPRQRTLRALIDWSFDLLDELERRLFRSLAVFAGGWTLEAAEAVCAGDGLDAVEVLDLLAHLVEKSLVVMDANGTRYRTLETVRAYAQAKLAESGDQATLSHRYVAHFVAEAETARQHLAGPEQGLWLARLDAERENFIAAHVVSPRAADGDALALRLMHALRPYWITRGDLSIGLGFAIDVLGRPKLLVRDESRCMALFGAGQYCLHLGRDNDAQRYLLECADIAREIGNTAVLARTLQPLGYSTLEQGHFLRAEEFFEEAVALATANGESREIAAALNALAMLRRAQGEADQAGSLLNQVIALARAQGDDESTAIGLLNLAMVSLDESRGDTVRQSMKEVLRIAWAVDSQPVWQGAAEVCAGLASLRGEWSSAARFIGAAEAWRKASGQRRYVADQRFVDPLIGQVEANLGAGTVSTNERAVGSMARAVVRAFIEEWVNAESRSPQSG